VAGNAFHFSGDEFVMIVPNARVPDLELSVNSQLASFKLTYEGREILGRAHVGLARHEPSCSGEELLQRAEHACKAGKTAGRSAFHVWTPALRGEKPFDKRWRCESCQSTIAVLVPDTTALQDKAWCAICGIERRGWAAAADEAAAKG
jgi:predicted signal transduction protein with EAL and GGDEF domain